MQRSCQREHGAQTQYDRHQSGARSTWPGGGNALGLGNFHGFNDVLRLFQVKNVAHMRDCAYMACGGQDDFSLFLRLGWSVRLFLKPEHATAQIKLILIIGHAMLEGGHNPAMNVFAALLGHHDASLSQNAQMFGDIVLGNRQAFRQFAHRQRTEKQFLHHPPPGLVRQGLEK
jgi:hypothetical protein